MGFVAADLLHLFVSGEQALSAHTLDLSAGLDPILLYFGC
jgi:hypothetical protein